jgi:hypothetical protein
MMFLKVPLNKIKIILIHIFIGAVVFYFLVHPFTMALYWFEHTKTTYSMSLFWEALKFRLGDAFAFNMKAMHGSLTAFGGLLGLLTGIYWINYKEKLNKFKKQNTLLKRDILKLIEQGENDWIEFKSSMRYDYNKQDINRDLEFVIAKTIVGFMNAKGGKLIIGVDDNGTILGLKNDFNTLRNKSRDGFERGIFNIISNYIGQESCYSTHVSFYQFDQSDICLVDVERSHEPVYLSEGKKTTFYVRTGNATHPLNVKDTVKYLNIKNNY